MVILKCMFYFLNLENKLIIKEIRVLARRYQNVDADKQSIFKKIIFLNYILLIKYLYE